MQKPSPTPDLQAQNCISTRFPRGLIGTAKFEKHRIFFFEFLRGSGHTIKMKEPGILSVFNMAADFPTPHSLLAVPGVGCCPEGV